MHSPTGREHDWRPSLNGKSHRMSVPLRGISRRAEDCLRRPPPMVRCSIRCLVMSGSGRRARTFPTRDFKRQVAPSASTTASSCATRWCCAGDRVPRRSRTFDGPIEISSLLTFAGNSWGSGWPMATSKQLQFLASDATAAAVREGLSSTPKRLPSWLFYDQTGSELFEQITELPEYYLTRTERLIFESSACEMLQAAGPLLTLVELGAGTASKTCILIEELLERQSRALFYPIDVSPSALQEAVKQLGQQFPKLRVNPIVADYTGGVEALNRITGRKLVLYIGSSIGNFEPSQAVGIMRRIRRSLRSGDALLLGADYAKSPKVLVPAYNDAQGVTAAFNKNILARLNRELDADFNLDGFRHIAIWNKACSRMEMHLESVVAQQVFLPLLDMDVTFAAGERIHTENSYKYTQEMLETILRESGFKLEKSWHDRQNWFGVHLARV